MFKRKVRVRVCVHDQPNKLHGGEQPATSETKGNVESSSEDR